MRLPIAMSCYSCSLSVQNRNSCGLEHPSFKTLGQLEDNLGALDVVLTPAQLTALEEASRPRLDFPAEFLRTAATLSYADTTINGEHFPAYH